MVWYDGNDVEGKAFPNYIVAKEFWGEICTKNDACQVCKLYDEKLHSKNFKIWDGDFDVGDEVEKKMKEWVKKETC